MDLSPRLAAIAAQVPLGACVADIGTDHAYLPVKLLLDGTIPSAIAADVNRGPLERGRKTARQAGVEKGIDFRLGDGLSVLREGEADAVVLAGMGGELIARILSQAPWTKRVLLLLQPMTGQPELRRWLIENQYRIEKETLVREGEKRYVILSVRGGDSAPYTMGELWAGRQAIGDESPLRLDYLDDLIARRRRALAGMQEGQRPVPAMEEVRRLIVQLEELRQEWITWQR